MRKRLLFWVLPLSIVCIILLFSIEESRTFVIALFLRIILFVKKNFIALLAAFFLVKGKFILKLFLKKIAILSATGLGKRYVVEKVIMGNVKIHFLDHISGDIKRLMRHAKKNFKNFPLVKKMMTIFAFLGSLGVIAKFMGVMLAVKVFLAKVWSFLLAILLKWGTAITYFFTDYLWGSWLAPIVEVVIFTWLLSWMEKVPFLARGLRRVYTFFIFLFGWMESYIEKIFRIPVKGFFKWLVKKIQAYIDHFIGAEHLSLWRRVKRKRTLNPNRHTKLLDKRQKRVEHQKERSYLSPREMLLQKRKYQK
ncbi:hypothetical protein MN086_01490 [Sulfurovum sp. XGS-02]|uniref:hypothetical protein n=1 Tax=Sulfurovum sp. XGS-02 TaxID=2925411 RepID=UPI002052F09D|nr:hypothetical protein [Sulfurovum sp. XGS-02]UPT77832.1 hypothetical protein MN086_01490 [Sulfurovum sp. XGS-02]